MTTATTRQNIRRELYNRIPGLGFSGVADSLASATLTDTYVFKDASVGPNAYRGMYLYRPDRSGDDVVRKIYSVAPSTGVVTVTGGNYSDTADTNYEVVGLMHPDELNACIKRAMNYVYLNVQVPLSLVPDGDMDASNTTSWTASGATISKITTASRVFSGFRSLRVLNSNTNQYAQSTAFRVYENRPFFASAMVHCSSGTATFQVYNSTGSTVIGSASTDETGWVRLWVVGNIPSGCESAVVRLVGAEASADLYWNHVVFYNRDEKRMYAPSWLDEQYKFLKLREAHYNAPFPAATGTGNYGADMANSLSFHDWRQPLEFSLDPLHNDANPYAVQLVRGVPERELWVQGKRPFSELEPLSADSSTTLAPLEQVYAHSKMEIVKVLKARYPSDKRWVVMYEDAVIETSAEDTARPDTPDQPIKREHMGRV